MVVSVVACVYDLLWCRRMVMPSTGDEIINQSINDEL